MASSKICPFCGGTNIMLGRTHNQGWESTFEPEVSRAPWWRNWLGQPCLAMDREAQACPDCGMVWAHLDAAELRAVLRKHGERTTQDEGAGSSLR